MISSADRRRVDDSLAHLEDSEVQIIDLGTPQLELSPDLQELLKLDRSIVPYLVERLRSVPPKTAAYLALLLRHLGGRVALAGLAELKLRYEALPRKTEWHFAAIGQCVLALKGA